MISTGKRWELSGCREASQARTQLSSLKAGHSGVILSCPFRLKSTSPWSWKVLSQLQTPCLPLITQGWPHRKGTALLLPILGKLPSTDGASSCKCMAVMGLPHRSWWRSSLSGWRHRRCCCTAEGQTPSRSSKAHSGHTGWHLAAAYKEEGNKSLFMTILLTSQLSLWPESRDLLLHNPSSSLPVRISPYTLFEEQNVETKCSAPCPPKAALCVRAHSKFQLVKSVSNSVFENELKCQWWCNVHLHLDSVSIYFYSY